MEITEIFRSQNLGERIASPPSFENSILYLLEVILEKFSLISPTMALGTVLQFAELDF